MPDSLPLDPTSRSPIPLYHRLYVSLREKIFRGEWQSGDLVPSEQEISKNFNVSRVTVRRALGLLEKEDLLRRFQGRGSFVAPKVETRPVNANIAEHFDNLATLRRQTRVRLIDFKYIPAPPEAQRKLQCEAGTIVQWSARVRLLNDTPVSYISSYVPEQIGRSFGEADLLSSAPVLSLIERSTEIDHAEQIISATLVDEKMSGLLKAPVGAPLLELHRLVFAPSGKRVMFSRSLYNPDYYQYRMNLEGPHGEGTDASLNIYD